MNDLFPELHGLIDRGDPRLRMLSTVLEAGEPLARLEASTRSSMWNMQRHWTIQSMRDDNELDAKSRRRGIELRLVLPARVAEQRCPLASSHYPYLRVSPVAHPLMVIDRHRVVVGDRTAETVWTTTEPDLVARAVRLYEDVWASAAPAVPDGVDPPFTPRMVGIALRLVDGDTDREIARALGVSERTVSADLRRMSIRLGARSRAHAIALISGVDG